MLATEGLQGSGDREHTHATVPSTTQHQGRVLPLAIKISSPSADLQHRQEERRAAERAGLLCPSPSWRGLWGVWAGASGLCLGLPSAPRRPWGVGSTSGEKRPQGSSCLAPHPTALGGLRSSKAVVGVNGIFV